MMIKRICLICLTILVMFFSISCGSEKISSPDKELVIGYIIYPSFGSLEELFAASDFVLKARVLDSRTEWMSHVVDPGTNNNPEADPGGEVGEQKVLTTIYELEIDTAYKGSVGNGIELMQLGGETDTTIYAYKGAPEIGIGHTYLLFLNQSGASDNAAWLINDEQAIYKVKGNDLIRLSTNIWQLTFVDLPK